GALLSELPRSRPHPSLVYVWSPAPEPDKRAAVVDALRKHARRRVELRWVRLHLEDAIERTGSPIASAVGEAVATRARAGETVGEHTLRRLGVSFERIRPRTPGRASVVPPPETERDAP